MRSISLTGRPMHERARPPMITSTTCSRSTRDTGETERRECQNHVAGEQHGPPVIAVVPRGQPRHERERGFLGGGDQRLLAVPRRLVRVTVDGDPGRASAGPIAVRCAFGDLTTATQLEVERARARVRSGPEPHEVPDTDNVLLRKLAKTPTRLDRDYPDPRPLLSDWVVTKPRLTGICGSDSKQIFMDFGDESRSPDNPMKGFFSLPQVLGHEVVADVVELGPDAEGLEVGDRVVLNPWLSCGPRGVSPMCPACERGDYSLSRRSRRPRSRRGSTSAHHVTRAAATQISCLRTTPCSSRCPTA